MHTFEIIERNMRFYLVFSICLIIFASSCSHDGVWSVNHERIYWVGDTAYAEIKMPDVQYAQVFMEGLKRQGYDCNKGCSECMGENVVVKRLITNKGVFIQIKEL